MKLIRLYSERQIKIASTRTERSEAMKNNDEEVHEMDAFFRQKFKRKDYAAENFGLEVRLRQKVKGKFEEEFRMANINVNELTKEQIAKAMNCETAEELMALAKAEGMELTKDEAEAYMTELEDFELDDETLKQAAGGMSHIPVKGHGKYIYGKW